MDDKYVWMGLVHMLMKELNTTDVEIYEKNYIACLNWVSYFYQKQQVEQSNQKGAI